ncbi:MAG: hypothetical protein K6G26_12720 [Lachnospiraceae bacterium]|nr:hypothetical protein [Lachnospiraceae bacterium]
MNRGRKSNKTKVIVTISIIAVVLILAAVGGLVFYLKKLEAQKKAKEEEERKKKEKVERIEKSTKQIEEYYNFAANKDYAGMYGMITAENKQELTEEEFTTTNGDFYNNLSFEEIKLDNIESVDFADTQAEEVVVDNKGGKKNDKEEEFNRMYLTYTVNVKTTAGEFSFDNETYMTKEENDWKIEWSPKTIYPNYYTGYKVKNSVTEPKRGSILDRNGKTLAANKSEKGAERTYPVANAAAHVVGYVHRATADDIAENGSYTAKSFKGKKGLEYAYEDRLRGQAGQKISIVDANGDDKVVLAEVKATDGEDIKTTLDANIQQVIYNQIKDENACSVAINPYTGEILAMLSTPAYDNNGIFSGTAADTYNRFARRFCPGSTFKPLTAAIGLDCGAFTADEDFGPSEKKWQKDSSWGNLYITTLHACQTATLINGITLSDNVYFAKCALKIGGKNLMAGLDKAGFNEKAPIVMNFDASQYSNGKSFGSEGMLANTGYGQGELLVNPLHMACVYSAFLNSGNMIMPCFEYSETSYWKENVFKADSAETVKNCLINVVESPEGTGYSCKRSDLTIGGKTGTAEIKQSQTDKNGTELGWFIAFTPDVDKDKAVLIVTMIEDVKDRGGSAYVVGKTKTILNQLYK